MGYYIFMLFLCFFLNASDGETTIIHVWLWEFIIISIIVCIIMAKCENDGNNKQE